MEVKEFLDPNPVLKAIATNLIMEVKDFLDPDPVLKN